MFDDVEDESYESGEDISDSESIGSGVSVIDGVGGNTRMAGSVSSILEDFSDIQKKYRIGDEQFKRGIHFATMISEGRDRVTSFMIAFGETDRIKSRTNANSFIRTKWVSSLCDRLIAGNYILFADKHYRAITELFEIGMNGASEKNRVDALKAFVEVTKRPEAKVDTMININLGSEMLDKLQEQLNALAEKSLLVGSDGEIIDVKIIS